MSPITPLRPPRPPRPPGHRRVSWPAVVTLPLLGALMTAVACLTLPARPHRTAMAEFLPEVASRRVTADVGASGPAGELRQAMVRGFEAGQWATASAGPALGPPERRWLQADVVFDREVGGEPVWQSVFVVPTDDALSLSAVTTNGLGVTFDPILPVLSPETLAGGRLHYTGQRASNTNGKSEPVRRPVTAEVSAQASTRVPGCTEASVALRFTDPEGGGFTQVLVWCPRRVPGGAGLAGLWAARPGEDEAGWRAEGLLPEAVAVPTEGAPLAWTPGGGPPSAQPQRFYRRVVALWQVDVAAQQPTPVAGGLLTHSDDTISASVSAPDDAEHQSRIVRWAAAPGGTITTIAGLGDLAVAASDARQLTGYSPTGRTAWQTATPGIVNTLTTDEHGHLVGTVIDGELFAVDARTGAVRWRRSLPDDVRQPAVLAGGQAVVRAGADVYAFDLATGSPCWHTEDAGVVDLAGADDTVVTLDEREAITRYAADGEAVWSRSAPGQPTGLVANAHAVVALRAEGSLGLDPADGHTRYDAPDCLAANLVGAVLACAGTRRVSVRDAGTGEVRREWPLPASRGVGADAPMITADGVVLRDPTLPESTVWAFR